MPPAPKLLTAKQQTPKLQTAKLQTTQGRLILGFLDRIEGDVIAGWAIDRLNPLTPLSMRVRIDGIMVDLIACNTRRPDLDPLNLPTNAVGFDYRIPLRYHDGLRHVLTFLTLEGGPVQLPGSDNRIHMDINFCITRARQIEGVLDGLVDGMIQGWALRVDNVTGAKTGGVRLLVSADGQPITELLADQFRADVAEAYGAEPSCGFSYALPPEFRYGRAIRLEVHAMPGRIALRQSPQEIFLPAETERGRILSLIERADELFRFAYNLRKDLKATLPADRFALSDYEVWARQNRPKIGARAAARYGAITGEPLVSVLCPVYRPDPLDFLAAVDSVIAQTYKNWELILVDDASKDNNLKAMIKDLAKGEPRIKVVAMAKNGGISAATNRALAEARGEVIAFFDHDDLLDPNALEVMLRARSATGARLLYSDEDKINRAGRFSDPNLKPDFNYRYLLDLNYICHLVLLDTGLAHEAGGLRSQFDGAQDHDFLLRLTERLKPAEIHHVAEVLYHWRISESSTAGNTEAKPQAATAGQTAIAEHLKRRKIKAKVERRGNAICYQTTFQIKDDPGVSILIPFRNHIDITRRCVEAIRKHTEAASFEIILLDNWSTDEDAELFCAEQANQPDTVVIRIAEPFNYSLINNRGVAAAKYPYLLFLNNDVFVTDKTWLRTLLNEALVSPEIAAVGAKLLYPNGTVQHAGVTLGVGGVGDHAFRGLPADAPGYVAHAIAAREVSAITGACMLVRRQAFNEVGGFDEKELGVAFNDTDLCIKLRQAGYRIVFTPDCTAEHHESMSRGDDLDDGKLARFMRENEVMRERWQHLLPYDPHYNRHFARDGGIFRDLRVLAPEDEPPFKRS